MRPLVRVQLLERRDGAEHRVAVVGAAAAVELALLDHRRPRAEPLAPAGHLGLLVEVAVDQHRVLAGTGTGNTDEQAGRAPFEPHDLELHARDRVLLAPARGESRGFVYIAMRLPVAVEVRRLGRDADVFDEGRDDRVLPELGNVHSEDIDGWKARFGPQAIVKIHRHTRIAGPERITALAIRPARSAALLDRAHRKCAGALKPYRLAEAPVQLEKGIAV